MTPLSDYVPLIIKDAIMGPDDAHKQYEKNITMLGTRGVAKTTALGCMELVCEIESTRNPNFTYRIDERTSGGISQISTDLCRGVFPRQTPSEQIYQASIYLTWKSMWGNKTVHIPVAETAGEDIENLMGPYRGGKETPLYKTIPSYRQAENLNRMIAASQAFILAIAVPRAPMPLPQTFDEEPESIHVIPDLNAYRILNSIFGYKQKRGAKRCEGIAVLLTKYDMVAPWMKEREMDLYDPEGAKHYLSTYFRKTMGILKNYGLKNVRFFPVHVQVEKQLLQDGSVRFVKWGSNSGKRGDKIKVDYDRNLPYFSEKSYRDLIFGWVKEILAG